MTTAEHNEIRRLHAVARSREGKIALMERFVEAVALAFPKDAERDRFGRYVGLRNCEPLRNLAVYLAEDYRDIIPNGGQDTADQAGMVARAILKALED